MFYLLIHRCFRKTRLKKPALTRFLRCVNNRVAALVTAVWGAFEKRKISDGYQHFMKMVHFIPQSQRRIAMLASQADAAPVLISGATGTGKGAIARWIHLNSSRSVKPFVNAKRDQHLVHQIPLAQDGTLFVSEIGEWPLSEQRALLDYLTTKSIPHLAFPNDNSVRQLANARVICTTTQGLEARAMGGLFNMELLEKLGVFRIEMPSLARRAEEFEDIALGILNEIAHELRKDHILGLSAEVMEKFRSYEWPCNLRELRNVLRVAVIQCVGDRIELQDLPEFGYDRVDFHATRDAFERIYLVELLKTFDWQIDKTAEANRMDPDLLLEKIRKHDIRLEPKPSIA